MSTFIDALDAYLTARQSYADSVSGEWPVAASVEAAERRLAETGDRLESVVRQMIRETQIAANIAFMRLEDEG